MNSHPIVLKSFCVCIYERVSTHFSVFMCVRIGVCVCVCVSMHVLWCVCVRVPVSVRELGMVPYMKIFLDEEQYRGPTLAVLEQLCEVNPEEFMSTAIGALCSSTQHELGLKQDLLQVHTHTHTHTYRYMQTQIHPNTRHPIVLVCEKRSFTFFFLTNGNPFKQ